MCETFAASEPPALISEPRPFVYISAEDIFRPVIPGGYINSKREAEQGIARMLNGRPEFRPVFMRPSKCHQRAKQDNAVAHTSLQAWFIMLT
jgi:hypothetical protein